MGVDLNDFSREQVCEYKGRRYFVRDNGAIYRQCKDDGRIRKWDEQWTFGKLDEKTGYLLIGQERVHRIVCTAYHGEPVGDRNVVDHKDTNRQNNRPENLHWVTRLENVYNNPITRAKIELICGSVEAFIADPSLLRGHESENPNFKWMRQVTPEEARSSFNKWKEWADKPIEERKTTGEHKGPSEWIFSKEEMEEALKWNDNWQHPDYKSWAQQKAEIEEETRRYYEEQYGLKDSLTPGAKQFKWKTPTEFLLCPQNDQERSLQAYLSNLIKGKVFSRTEYGDGGKVLDSGYNADEEAVYVLSYNKDSMKPWALCRITFQDGFFVHENCHSFFEKDGGKKYFSLAMGREWTGGDVFDDFC